MQMTSINISPVLGGFVISYPTREDDGTVGYAQEVATTVGKAMRIAKVAVEAFSLVAKAAAEADPI